MSSKLEWYPTHCVMVYKGQINIKDTMHTYGQLVGHSNADSLQYMIVDTRGFTGMDYEPKDYEIHASLSKSAARILNQSLNVGVVVESAEAEAAVKKLLQAIEGFPHNWNRQIFHSYDEAVDWVQTEPKPPVSTFGENANSPNQFKIKLDSNKH